MALRQGKSAAIRAERSAITRVPRWTRYIDRHGPSPDSRDRVVQARTDALRPRVAARLRLGGVGSVGNDGGRGTVRRGRGGVVAARSESCAGEGGSSTDRPLHGVCSIRVPDLRVLRRGDQLPVCAATCDGTDRQTAGESLRANPVETGPGRDDRRRAKADAPVSCAWQVSSNLTDRRVRRTAGACVSPAPSNTSPRGGRRVVIAHDDRTYSVARIGPRGGLFADEA
jgi:hypothetical protein